MTRVYYHLEEAGEKRLEELVEDYLEVTEAIHKIMDFPVEEAKELNKEIKLHDKGLPVGSPLFSFYSFTIAKSI